MLNFCPLCVAEVYALRCDAMLAGTSHYPLHRPTTTYYLCCIRYAVFLYLQNLYLSTSKRCIKMGIPSLKSAIYMYWFIFLFTDPHVAALLRMTWCHLERSEWRNLKPSHKYQSFHQFLW